MVNPYQGVICRKNAARSIAIRYRIALIVIALAACAGFVMVERIILQHERVLELVNVGGRQRMLSQRAALLVERLIRADSEQERADLLHRLTDAADQFEHAHQRLTGTLPSPWPARSMSAALRDLYFGGSPSLDQQAGTFVAALWDLAGDAAIGPVSADHPAARYIAAQSLDSLLDRLEPVVAQYQIEGEAALATLYRLEALLLILMLATLAAEALVIFRPMVRQVSSQFAEITRITDELRAARDRLEEQVRQRTRELEAAKEEAEKANHAKSRFLAAAGHDLLQPLEVIAMFSGMLERSVTDERSRAIVHDLRGAQRSMRILLGALLDISRLEAGVVAARPEAVALGPLLDQMAAEFTPLADAKGLGIRVIGTGALVRTDPELLLRILRNLLSNAVRYTAAGSILLGCRRQGGALRIEVHDTGCGIPEADRARIFQEFIQLGGPPRDRSEGMGLGLAIVERLARLLGHGLDVRSAEGRGSVFAVTVPVIANAPFPAFPQQSWGKESTSPPPASPGEGQGGGIRPGLFRTPCC